MKKLSDWAKDNGVTYQTAWNWFKMGKMPCPCIKTATGTILVEDSVNHNSKIYIYGRVSSSEKKQDLESQIKICEQFCLSNGWQVDKVFKEIASGMNDNRKQLNKILEDPPSKLVVLYKDRLTRFGFNYLDKTLAKLGCQICVIHKDKEEESDLIKDLVAIITSFCCRLYGARRGQAKAAEIKNSLANV